MSPLEYLFFAMMSTQQPDPALGNLTSIEPAAGKSAVQNTMVVSRNGHFEMPTILMEPRDRMADKIEAPMRITPEWTPVFKVGAPLSIKIDETNKVYDAKIARIESITDETGLTVQVIAELEKKPAELQPGMTGVAIMTSTQ
jgi:hypothetical protein